HYGSLCQYRTDQFGFSLEILLTVDHSNSNLVQKPVEDYDETFSYISKWSIGVLSINRAENTKHMKTSAPLSKTNIKFTSEDKRKLLCYGVIIILVSATTVTDISFHRIIVDRKNNNQDICITEYSSNIWKTFDTIVLFIHQLVPFMLNVYATGIILSMAARNHDQT
ncbi:unnamed protein product, partial [Didymodactylos carnosus]